MRFQNLTAWPNAAGNSKPMAFRVGVLALQGDVIEHVQALQAAGAEAHTVRTPKELDSCDALVIPGGESTTIEKLARIFEVYDPIRQRISAGMPVFGTCAGMIMLADRIAGGTADQRSFGGLDITVRRNAFGRQIASFEADIDVVGLEDQFHAVFIRAPWVEEVGPGVEVLATDPTSGRIVAVRQGVLMATAFHPEIGGDHRMHEMFLSMANRN